VTTGALKINGGLEINQGPKIFWRSPWLYLEHVSTAEKLAWFISVSQFKPTTMFAERDLVITGLQIGTDDDTNGDTYYFKITRDGEVAGYEITVTTETNHKLYNKVIENPVSFSAGQEIGLRVRSAEGGEEEVYILLHGYCTN
jgi:hypothetical protein